MSLPTPKANAMADNRTTMELGAVLPATATVQDTHLFIGGVDMVELAHQQGTALYVYDEEDLRERMRAYRSSFNRLHPNSEVIYASKAFLNKAMARIAAEEGMSLDVSGGGELAIARAAGFPADRVYVHGNNKTPEELEEAITAGVKCIVIDSRIELARVSQIAERHGITQDVFMRITPGVEADTHEYIRTGMEDSKFGFTMRDDFAFKCIDDVLAASHVRLAGIHMHIGSQIFALHSYREAVAVAVDFIARIKKTYGYTIDVLDVGGGVGIAYQASDQPASIEEFATLVCESVDEECAKAGIENLRILCEPGRSIAAIPGVTLYTVGILKTLPGIRKYVAVDGGMSDNIRTALYHADFEAVLANKADEPRTEVVTLCGKHCESGDAVVLDGSLQHPELGDIVCVFGTGAYCQSMSSNYNGQVRPAVVFVRDGVARVVTRRQTYADLVACDID
ncbi:diaminopimelate decarboxylase [Cryptobacterium curtum]